METVCLASQAFCVDGFCHAACSGPTDFCDDANPASDLSNDRCLQEPDGGAFVCATDPAVTPRCGP